jgi:hypothetical protein
MLTLSATSQRDISENYKSQRPVSSVNIYEYYFYPEYAIKSDTLINSNLTDIQFQGMKDTLEKVSNFDTHSNY